MYAVPKALRGFLHQSVLTYKGLGFSRIVLLWRPLLAQERNCRLGFTRWSPSGFSFNVSCVFFSPDLDMRQT